MKQRQSFYLSHQLFLAKLRISILGLLTKINSKWITDLKHKTITLFRGNMREGKWDEVKIFFGMTPKALYIKAKLDRLKPSKKSLQNLMLNKWKDQLQNGKIIFWLYTYLIEDLYLEYINNSPNLLVSNNQIRNYPRGISRHITKEMTTKDMQGSSTLLATSESQFKMSYQHRKAKTEIVTISNTY